MATQAKEIFEIDTVKYFAAPTMAEFMSDAGIAPSSAKLIVSSFKKLNITHVSTLFALMRSDLVLIDKVTEASAVKIATHAVLLRKKGKHVQAAGDLRHKSADLQYIPTGSSSLDKMLAYSNGEVGWRTKTVVELYAPPSLGKTQIAHTAGVMVMRELKRGVVYIDSEGAFDLPHYESIARYWGVTSKDIDEKLLVSRVMNFDEVELALDEIGKIAHKKDIGCVIVDSIMDPLKAQYPVGGQELRNLQPRQKHLKRVIDKMKKMGETHNMLIIYTNHVRSEIGNTGKDIGPQGGAVLGHASDIRIELSKAPKAANEVMKLDYNKMSSLGLKSCRAKIVDCGFLAENTGYYLIGPFGVSDPSKYTQVVDHAKRYAEAGYMVVDSYGRVLEPLAEHTSTKTENADRNQELLYGKDSTDKVDDEVPTKANEIKRKRTRGKRD